MINFLWCGTVQTDIHPVSEEVSLDIDMNKVRYLRIMARTIQYSILFFLSLYSLFCFWFVAFQEGELDYNFFAYLLIPIPVFLYQEIRERFSSDRFLVKVNRWLAKQDIHARLPTETETNIVQGFFDDHGFEMPLLLTADGFGEINAFACRCFGKEFLLITEDMYRKCSPQDIWITMAHEKGHFLNDRVFEMYLKNGIFFCSSWFSFWVLVKTFGYYFFFSSGLLFPAFVYLTVTIFAFYFLWSLKNKCEEFLYLAVEVLADNSAAIMLGSPEPMIRLLQKFAQQEGLFVAERKFALSWISKKEIL